MTAMACVERAEGERLVSSKTSQGTGSLVLFAPNIVAEKRVARLKRSVWASGHLHAMADHGFRPPVCWFVTLTYADAQGWRADHMSQAVERFRQWCRRVGVRCRYTWVAEIQDGSRRADGVGRGAVHYHLLAWLPPTVQMPSWGKKPGRRHRRFWEHGRSETELAKAGVGYLMKYLSKLGEYHRFPKGLRLYGIGGLDQSGRAVRSWHNLPQWAKLSQGVGDTKRSRRGLVVQSTGEILTSPYRVRRVPGGLEVRLVGEIPRRFCGSHVMAGQYPGAFSSWPREECA